MRKKMFRHLTQLTSILALGALLSACGGSEGNALKNVTSPPGNNNQSNAQMGAGAGANFRVNEIDVGIGDNMLSAGGSTLLSVNVVNNGELVTDSVGVAFNSPCIAAGQALIEPQAGSSDSEDSSNAFQTTNGQATVRYVANGCIGSDTVRASATYGGGVISAQATLDIAADTVTSLTFIDAEPNYISLKGTGGEETTTVSFRVRGSTGAPVKDVQVNFSLNTTAGGLQLVNSSDVSGTDGYVSTTLQAGSVPTSVRITATTEGGISTQSARVVVSTGLPDQNSFSVASTDLAPNGWNFDGVEAQITVNTADAFNNPAPIGTPIYFTTNGGAIESACLVEASENNPSISSGRCSVTWKSQNPRPMSDVALIVDESTLSIGCSDGHSECRDGRLKIVATTLGNESFIDTNGNGLYDPGVDVFYTADSPEGDTAARTINCRRNQPVSGSASHQMAGGNSTAFGCDDLGDPYVDRNFNGRYDSNEEIATIDNQVDASYTRGDGIYNGVLCRAQDAQAGLCSQDSVLVRADLTLVMSCDEPLMINGRLPGQPVSVSMTPGSAVTYNVLLADCNGNGLPAGTELEVETGSTSGISTGNATPEVLASSQEPGVASVFIKASDNEIPAGTVYLNITIPQPGEDGGTVTYGFPTTIR